MADISVSGTGSEDTDVTQIEFKGSPTAGEFSLYSFIQVSMILSIFLYFFGVCHEKIYHFLIVLPSSAGTLKVLTDEDSLYDTQRATLRYWCIFSLFWIVDVFIPFNYVYSLGKLFLHAYFLHRVFEPRNLFKTTRTEHDLPLCQYGRPDNYDLFQHLTGEAVGVQS